MMTPQQRDTLQVIQSAHLFTIRRFEGRGKYTKAEASTLNEALEIAKQIGKGPYGQKPMIYAVNAAGRSVHVEQEEYQMDDCFYVCDYRDPAAVKITDYPNREEAEANCPSEGGASIISSEDDLRGLTSEALLYIYNHLRRSGPPETAFEDQEKAAHRVWTLLSSPRDRAMGEQPKKEITVATKRAKAKEPKAKREAKAPKVKKAAAPKKAAVSNGHDAFGLRKGSQVSEAARMFARDNGATMAEVKEKTGANQYNLLAKLKEAGHKVKSEEGKFYLTAK